MAFGLLLRRFMCRPRTLRHRAALQVTGRLVVRGPLRVRNRDEAHGVVTAQRAGGVVRDGPRVTRGKVSTVEVGSGATIVSADPNRERVHRG